MEIKEGQILKTLHILIIFVPLAFCLFETARAQYGLLPSEQASHTAALQQALFEKQMEDLKQKDEQLGRDSQIITLLMGISIGLSCATGIVTWIVLKTRKITKK